MKSASKRVSKQLIGLIVGISNEIIIDCSSFFYKLALLILRIRFLILKYSYEVAVPHVLSLRKCCVHRRWGIYRNESDIFTM